MKSTIYYKNIQDEIAALEHRRLTLIAELDYLGNALDNMSGKLDELKHLARFAELPMSRYLN